MHLWIGELVAKTRNKDIPYLLLNYVLIDYILAIALRQVLFLALRIHPKAIIHLNAGAVHYLYSELIRDVRR